MKVAVIHDWLIGMRGGEKVLEEICRIFPDSEIFTLFYFPGNISPLINSHSVHPSFLQKIPGALKHYRYFLPFYPTAVERFNLEKFDLVISISHCAAKGVKVPEGVPHICYCLTPMRYIWDNYDAYFARGRASIMVRTAVRAFRPYLRRWDVKTVSRVDSFIAISQFVAQRIQNYYHREPEIIYPPVDTDYFTLPESPEKEDFYLIVSALVPYKRIDLAVSVFNQLPEKRLKIVGVGPEIKRLKQMARGNNIEFLNYVDQAALRRLYQKAWALIFCGEEDFGIAMAEAQSCGTPVVAHNRGGATEIIVDASLGTLFNEMSAEALHAAIEKTEAAEFNPDSIRRNAGRFGIARFQHEFKTTVQRMLGKLKS